MRRFGTALALSALVMTALATGAAAAPPARGLLAADARRLGYSLLDLAWRVVQCPADAPPATLPRSRSP